jgi:tetratricopeptide (TPR) repeat protein/transcriptional regulator with XRE-family HTH domain
MSDSAARPHQKGEESRAMPASNPPDKPSLEKKEPSPTPNTLLKAQRLKKHWSQVYVATMIGTNDVTVSRWESGTTFPSLYYRQQLCELFGKSAEELGLIPPIEELEPSGLPEAPRSSSAIWKVPHRRNPFFTGRTATLERLHTQLRSATQAKLPQALALSGLGGVGKTQTAIEYAYRYRDEYAAVFWVKADTQENLLNDLADVARVLNLPEQPQQDQGHIVQAVTRWLSEQSNWLLILDNIENLMLLNEIIPAEWQGHILLTTRAQVTGTVALRIDLEQMNVEEGILFLLRRAKYLSPNAALAEAATTEYTFARKMVELVGGLPLALDQVGAYIEETGCGLQDYLERYQAQRARLLHRRGSLAVDHPESVGATLSLSFEQVERSNPEAAELLRLCAFLDPDTIPEEVLLAAADTPDPELHALAANSFALDEALAALRRYSLIRRDPAAKTLLVHRLVQIVLKDSMSAETQRQWAERAVQAISRTFPDVHDSTAWAASQRCWPQALVGIALIEHWSMMSAEAAQLLKHAGVYLQRGRGDYPQAERLFKKAIVMYRRVLGAEHPELASCLNKLAVLYRFEEKLAQAERLHLRALAIREQTLDPMDPVLAESYNNLSVLYMDMGQSKWEQAEQLCLRGLAIREHVLGPEHPSVAISLNNLGGLYHDQQRYAEAEAIERRALAIREKTLGPEHPEVAITLKHLADLDREQGRYAQAEALYLRALAIQEKAYGQDHPHIAVTRSNYALLQEKMKSERQAGQENPPEPLLLSNYLESRTRRRKPSPPTSADASDEESDDPGTALAQQT